MTIKELEQAVGMTRANIRFYEQEGLLCPARGENGYRDYSQADAETLERIKLLRRLHLGLEDIRALQAGTLRLSDALAEQLQKLEADQAALDRAREVCDQLRSAGTDYAHLDPRPWLRELEREREPASERFAPPKDEAVPVPGHPWRRYFARMMDLGLYGLVFTFLESMVLHIPLDVQTSAGFRLLDSYLGLGLMLLAEPFLLHFWGTTPGKWLFGIVLREADGEKLSLERAWRRTFGVFRRGLGWGVPGYELYRLWKSYKTVDDFERCEWEWSDDLMRPERMEIPDGAGRCVAYVGARTLLLGVMVLTVLQGMMPPCRGELSLEGFCRNMNFYNSYFARGETRWTEEGTRRARELPDTVVIVNHLQEVWEDRWSPVVEGGETVGFRYDLHAEGTYFSDDFNSQQLGVMAFAGALPGTNCVGFFRDGWLRVLEKTGWEFDFSHRGVRLTQSARFQGVDDAWPGRGDVFAFGEGKGPVTLDLTFTIRRE